MPVPDAGTANVTGLRILAVLRAVAALAAHPHPQSLSDGLSEPMARRCLALATGEITREALTRALDVPGVPPRQAVVVAARGVFTAPLEWVVLLAGAGARVHLKVPHSAPAFGLALARAFQDEGLPVVASTDRVLPDADAVVAMGSDETMAALAPRVIRAHGALHGHRFSVALVDGDPGEDLARALADDVCLFDGRGCFTPTAIFVLPSTRGGDPPVPRLGAHLARALEEAERLWPVGDRAGTGPEWRRRVGLARARGRLHGGGPWAVAEQEGSWFEASALPRFIGVHPVRDLDQVARLLEPWRGRIAACATTLDPPEPLQGLRVERWCRPGHMQRPPFGRPHGGMEAFRSLCFHPSLELGTPGDTVPGRGGG